MARHTVLTRQLRRCNLNESALPQTLTQWHQFLDRVHRTYTDWDQDRYLAERSQQISSRELQELYLELQEAQSIAHSGSWSYDLKTNQITASIEAYHILQLDMFSPLPTYQQILEMIYSDDRSYFKKYVRVAMEQGEIFDIEIRIRVNNQIHWLQIIGKPIKSKENNLIEKISGIVMDITQRKMTTLRQVMEHKILRLLIESEALSNTVIKNILEIICVTLNCELGVFWNWDAKQKLLIRQEFWGKNTAITKEYLTAVPSGSCKLKSHFLINTVWKTHQAYWLDVSQERIPKYSNFFRKLNLYSTFAFPVQIKNKPIAVLDFFSSNNAKLDKDVLQNISSIGNQIGLFIERKYAQERERELNKQLVLAARQTGMAEVATSVLHNIGNVLNSINVSATLLKEKLQQSELFSNFINVVINLKKHIEHLDKYLSEDPQGKHLTTYLALLKQILKKEQLNASKELDSLIKNIQHIKDIVSMQQVLGGSVGIIEPVSISEQLDTALVMIELDATYTIVRQYEIIQPICLDRVKLLQIFINLIRNAKDALKESKSKKKKLTLTIKKKSDDLIEVRVIDNGIGIIPQNITRIFSFGFSTKNQGHGFGLHTSALSAKEIGGSLRAESDGFEKGATFILNLPYLPRG